MNRSKPCFADVGKVFPSKPKCNCHQCKNQCGKCFGQFLSKKKNHEWDEISRNRVLYQLVCNLGMRMYVGKSFEKSVSVKRF
jgi:hypothetical protein